MHQWQSKIELRQNGCKYTCGAEFDGTIKLKGVLLDIVIVQVAVQRTVSNCGLVNRMSIGMQRKKERSENRTLWYILIPDSRRKVI